MAVAHEVHPLLLLLNSLDIEETTDMKSKERRRKRRGGWTSLPKCDFPCGPKVECSGGHSECLEDAAHGGYADAIPFLKP